MIDQNLIIQKLKDQKVFDWNLIDYKMNDQNLFDKSNSLQASSGFWCLVYQLLGNQHLVNNFLVNHIHCTSSVFYVVAGDWGGSSPYPECDLPVLH